jgi:serine protease
MTRAATIGVVVMAAGSWVSAQGIVAKADNPIANQYIVVFKDEAVSVRSGKAPQRLVRGLADELAVEHGAVVQHRFASALSGFSARMSAEEAETLARDPRVALVEQDGVVEAQGVQSSPSWGLDRVDQRTLPLNGRYSYSGTGSGVDVFVIDSGIRSTHADLAGRVDTADAFTAIADGYGTEDCFGHGTMVAGLIGGTTYGVAKGVTLHPVRVIGCSGYGAVSDLVAGVDWVTGQRQAAVRAAGGGAVSPWVANISLITGISDCLDNAVTFAMQAGVTFVVAAGNYGGDACLYSPAHVDGAITVGATNDADNVWVSSDGGACVDLFAPGFSQATAYNRSDTDQVLFTGTSAAAPMATGAAALFLQVRPAATPDEVAAFLVKQATPRRLAAMPSGSPNLLLYTVLANADLPPVASFAYTCNGRKCTFDASDSSDDKRVRTYAWSFGDGSSDKGQHLRHTFPTSGSSFVVTLSVTDSSRQIDSMTQTVRFAVAATIESLPVGDAPAADLTDGAFSILR